MHLSPSILNCFIKASFGIERLILSNSHRLSSHSHLTSVAKTTTMVSSRATTKVIVVGGGGTMGSSTALHLIRAGYTPSNITVLDVYPIPSAQSAGYDLNKIMGIRLRNRPDLQLSLEALDMWTNDPLFKPFFHKVGMVRLHPIPWFSLSVDLEINTNRLIAHPRTTGSQTSSGNTNHLSTRTLAWRRRIGCWRPKRS